MEPMYYIGMDVHKRKISYCVKDSSGKVYAEGSLPATRALRIPAKCTKQEAELSSQLGLSYE